MIYRLGEGRLQGMEKNHKNIDKESERKKREPTVDNTTGHLSTFERFQERISGSERQSLHVRTYGVFGGKFNITLTKIKRKKTEIAF